MQTDTIDIQLSTGQATFLEKVMSGENVFLTGKAGTGKSYITKEAIRQLKASKKKVVAIAPTGVAANNIGGQTIHSLFGINPFGISTFDSCNLLKGEKRRLLAAIEVIFIDEVSMLRPDILDAMHWTLLKNGCDGLHTKQVIFIGDLKQLPPVLDDNARSILYRTYDGDQFSYAQVYKKLNVQEQELTEVLRQSDEEFIHNLNLIRDGGKSEYFRRFVNPQTDGIILAPHNATVQRYNEDGLAAQKGELMTFHAEVTGNIKAEDFNLETVLKVKNGCKVMYLVNSKNNDLVNGTLGIFVSHNDCHYIRVGNVDYALERIELSKKEYVYDKFEDELVLRDIGSICQYPIRLAYALSIHKAQGLTFDSVTVDLSRPCFQKGQLYVALSRVTSPEGLRIVVK